MGMTLEKKLLEPQPRLMDGLTMNQLKVLDIISQLKHI